MLKVILSYTVRSKPVLTKETIFKKISRNIKPKQTTTKYNILEPDKVLVVLAAWEAEVGGSLRVQKFQIRLDDTDSKNKNKNKTKQNPT